MIQAVLFDCDGVLADSETLVNAIVADELSAIGWPMSGDDAEREFLGLSFPDMRPIIAARVGALPEGWEAALKHRIENELAVGLQPMPGAGEALRRVAQAGLPMAVCSNSARKELMLKMRVLGFSDAFGDRVFSFEDVARPKPAPDLYLAAAIACGVAPAHCLVVEDSAAGVAAGLAAGCQVVGLLPGLGVPYLADLAMVLG